MASKEMKEIEELYKKEEERVKAYFRYCPFCYKEESMSFEWGLRKSYMFCKDCGAKWYLHYSWGALQGAQLINASVDGKGNELLQKEHKPEFWQAMGLKGHKALSSEKQEKVVKEREVIREIVKIRCPYCHKLYDESQDKCPNCGAPR